MSAGAEWLDDAAARRRGEDWPEPTPLPDGLPPVPAFDPELLPELLRRRVGDISDRMQCPPDFPAVACMTMLSGVIGRRWAIQPKRRDHWRVIPNLWGAAVSGPGLMKTPALEEALRPIRKLQGQAVERYEAARAEYAAGELVREQSGRVAKESIKAALKKGDSDKAFRIATQAVEDEEDAPTCARFIVNDSTVEKLGELLAQNPHGLLLYRDELNGFFRTLERSGHEADRAFYLEAWNGDGSYTYDRIGRGTIHIPAVCLAVLGSIQPGPLGELVRAMRTGGDDGLIQRFQLAVWPDATPTWRNVDRCPDLDAADEVFRLVLALAECTPAEPTVARFDEAGQEIFDAWRSDLEHRVRRGDLHPMMESHLSKYRSLVPSLALIDHLVASVSFVSTPHEHSETSIGADSVIRAIAWAEYLEPHARRMYSPAISPDIDSARALAARITAGEVAPRFALRDIYRNGWAALATPEAVTGAARVLEDFDWLRSHEEPTAGRTRTVYTLNPHLAQEVVL